MNDAHSRPLPRADAETGLLALKALIRKRSLLGPLEIMHQHVGDAFQITLPGFQPAVLVGPQSNREVLVTRRHLLNWRTEKDPVTRLLRHGLLVEDGQTHHWLRTTMEPALQRSQIIPQAEAIWRMTDQISGKWPDGGRVDMLVEMRRAALLILLGTLFGVDFMPDMERLWTAVLRTLKYIAPGPWIIFPDMPRLGYGRALKQMDEYLYRIIRDRRQEASTAEDLLTRLVTTPGMDDDLIRDQLLTMLIAGHDTSTALLAWTLYLLGTHPKAMARCRQEVDQVLQGKPPAAHHLSRLRYLDQVIKESLRLYPPIHVGNRQAAGDMQLCQYAVEAGTRVMYSIYLSHRDKANWEVPSLFCPERFDRTRRSRHAPFAYVPFGGGPRNCIGAVFAQIEAKIVLARLIQTTKMELIPAPVHAYMGATLEPHPGVHMLVKRRDHRG